MAEEKSSIELVHGDVLDFAADVLALKYAQHYYGADEAVSSRLISGGAGELVSLQPPVWQHVIVSSKGLLPSRDVLFLGVPRLLQFNYNEIEHFGFEVIRVVAAERPDTQHIALTLHGPAYGLDEVEALQSELRGILKAVHDGHAPARLRRVSIVERTPGRVERLSPILAEANARWSSSSVTTKTFAPSEFTASLPAAAPPPSPVTRAPGAPSPVPPNPAFDMIQKPPGKPRIFVAMPYATEMEDVYYYGIQNPVRQLGFICERIDQEAFTGDVLPQMKTRIEAAEIVIADLTGSNPNVYLEVGYAWGKQRPTVLLVKDSDQLKFDVRGQRCLTYKSIKDLETQLTRELRNLSGKSDSE